MTADLNSRGGMDSDRQSQEEGLQGHGSTCRGGDGVVHAHLGPGGSCVDSSMLCAMPSTNHPRGASFLHGDPRRVGYSATAPGDCSKGSTPRMFLGVGLWTSQGLVPEAGERLSREEPRGYLPLVIPAPQTTGAPGSTNTEEGIPGDAR